MLVVAQVGIANAAFVEQRWTYVSLLGWSDAPGAFPGAYQTVRDGNNEEFA